MPNKIKKSYQAVYIFKVASRRASKIFKVASRRVSKALNTYSKPRIYYKNITNRILYGPSAPKHAEVIYVRANEVDKILPLILLTKNNIKPGKNASGMVIKSDWPFCEALFLSNFIKSKYYKEKKWVNDIDPRFKQAIIIASCIDHWINQIPWEDTGLYDFMEALQKYKGSSLDGYTSRYNIIERHKNLDLIFEQVQLEGRFRMPQEVDPCYYRKTGDLLGSMSIGSNGDFYWTGGSNHRFSISYILKLPLPVIIGLVHVNAIPYLNSYRNK